MPADLVLVDLEKETAVNDSKLYSKCGWSPFANHIFTSSIRSTFVNGHLVFDGKSVISASNIAQPLTFVDRD